MSEARLDLCKLGNSVRKYFQQGLAPSTQRSYDSAKAQFINFCSSAGSYPLPLSENLLCFYVSFLADKGLAHSSIKCYLAAARHLQISHGLPDPNIGDMPRLKQIIRGIKSFQAKQGRQSRPRLPITPTILRSIRNVWSKSSPTHDQVLLWAAFTLAFFGFLRSGEICSPSDKAYDPTAHLSFSDVAIDDPQNPSIMRVHLKTSKTDPFRKGVDIFLGRTYNELCPISAMLAYLAVRGGAEGPLFKFQNGLLLTRDRLVAELRKVLSATDIRQSDYCGHSFRIGAATTAAQRGISDSTIQLLGRWESSAYLLYIRTPREQLAAITRNLASAR